jgi:hypothetical protein
MSRTRIVVLAALAALALSQTAEAAATRTCKSTDLRYPFTPGGKKDFGVFALRITGGSCTTARHIAHAWMRRFEADIRKGRVRLPKNVEGFAFATLPSEISQTYVERGRKGRTTIRFDYRVPNG